MVVGRPGEGHMDDVTGAIAAFVTESSLKKMSAAQIDATVMHLVDALGCAIAATETPPYGVVRDIAAKTPSLRGSSVIGSKTFCSPEMAAFANTCMVRALDFNDTYNSRSGGHPSVLFPGILAVVEERGLSGAALLQGIHVASEVYGWLCDSISLRENGWDAGTFVCVAGSAGVSSVLGASAAAVAHAAALSISSGAHMGVIRAGTLSARKGCAEGHAVMNGVLMARLAEAGMTGPARPFRAVNGFEEQIARPLELGELGALHNGKTVLQRTAIKFMPIQWTTQAPIEKLLTIRQDLNVDDIVSVTFSGPEFMWKAVGGGRGDATEKWNPQTRETADHSLPYLAAVALVDGGVTLDSFTEERVLDPALRPMMQKIRVVEDPATKKLSGGRQPTDIIIELKDGRVVKHCCEFAHGHYTNPATNDEVDEKFMMLAGRVLDRATAAKYLKTIRDVAAALDVTALTAVLRSCPPAS
jgi:2-methylcitrate dehydratase